PGGSEHVRAFGDRSVVAEDERGHGDTVRRSQEPAVRLRLVGERTTEIAIEAEQFARLIERMDHEAAENLRDRMQLVFERRDDPEVAAAAAQRQKRSGFSVALATRSCPSAVTTSAESRLSPVSPCLPMSQPTQPRRVRPAIPVFETVPPVVASPHTWVSRSSSRQSTPPSARTVRARGSTRIPFIGARSITKPPSLVP